MQRFVDWFLGVSPKLIPSLVHVFVILAVGLFVLRLIDSALRRFARIAPSDDAHRDRIKHRTETLRHFVRSAGRAVLGITAFATVAIDLGVAGYLSPFLGTAAIAGLAIGFGAQTLVKDVIAGFFVLFEDQYGVGETERLPPQAYAAEATRKVYATLAAKAQRTIAAGHSAIVDAVFAAPEERAAIAEIGGPRFHGLFLVADLETRLARAGARSDDASDAGAEVARRQESYDLGAVDWSKVDASGTPDDTLKNARAALAR